MINSFLDFILNSHGKIRLYALATLALWFARIIVFPALVSLLCVRYTITLSHSYNVLARPSDRGSHTIPTPRLGGMGSAVAFYLTVLMLLIWDVYQPLEPWRLTLLVGGAWALIGGALDDVLELPPRWKLLVQLAAIGCVYTFGFAPSQFDVPFTSFHLGPTAGTLTALITSLFLMNIFNFMDGMDGQASLFGIITGLGLGIYVTNHGLQASGFGLTWNSMLPGAFAVAAASTLIGVMWYNYPGRPIASKTFLGDCGSQFYGFVLAIVALQAGEPNLPQQRFPWIASLILFSPFIYDVAFTLVRRYRRGERLTQAHRSHLYQRLMVAGWSHGKTLKFNAVLYVIMLVLSWLYAASYEHGFLQLLILAIVAALLTGYTLFVMNVEKHSPVLKARAHHH